MVTKDEEASARKSARDGKAYMRKYNEMIEIARNIVNLQCKETFSASVTTDYIINYVGNLTSSP